MTRPLQFSIEAWRQRMLNPPEHLLELRPHVAQAPPAVQSRLVPMIKADTFHTCAELLRRASMSNAPKARRLRTRALDVLKQDLSEEPRFAPYLDYIEHDPSQFTGHRKEWAAFTQGWSDATTAAGRPRAFLNTGAFESVMKLTTVVHHEGPGHLRQRFSTAEFKPPTWDTPTLRNYWSLGEVDAHLNDLQHRKSLGMTAFIKSYGLQRAEESWRGLADQHRSILQDRYSGTRQFVRQELHDTAWRSPPSYSQLGGSATFRLRGYAHGLGVSPTMFPSTLPAMGRGLYR